MLVNKKIYFELICLFLIINVIDSDEEQQKSLIESILKNGKQGFLKSYIELPDSDLFINSDIINKVPAKFFNYSSNIRNAFNDWDETEFVTNLTSCFIYANMAESTSKHRFIESKTNLARFLQQKEQYSYETSIHYQMPLFIKYN
jgi:hypothetical protein